MAEPDDKWEKLLAIVERLSSQPPPTINVNVVVPDGGRKKKPDTSGSSPAQEDVNEPRRQPHPFVS